MRIIPAFFLAMFLATIATAQPIYESTGKSDAVFSDRPVQGDKVIDLPPINVMNPLAIPPPMVEESDKSKKVAAVPYATLKISAPENGGTIHSNTGQITIKSKVDPALQLELGHVIVARLDNTAISTTHKTMQFDIMPAEWQIAAADSVEHRLEIAVLDASGKLLIKSEPVGFFVHRATAR